MEERSSEISPGLGPTLERLRRRKRFSVNALAEESGVSRTYITQIESGIDSRTGKKIEPSPGILRKLADTLAAGEAEEANQIYQELMAQAGYLPVDAAVNSATAPPLSSLRTSKAASPSFDAAPLSPDVMVELRDPRLLAHGRAVLENWEELYPDEQAVVLGFLEFIDEKRRRRQSGAQRRR